MVIARVAGVLLLAGCAHPTLPHPDSALLGFASAETRDDPHAAYLLLSAAVRSQLSEAKFTDEWRDSAAERVAHAKALEAAATKRRWKETSQVRSDPWVASLVRDPNGWRLLIPRRTQLGAATPEDAVRRLALALESHDLDALLQLLADPLKTVVEHELADRLARLHGAAGKIISVEGDHARVRFDQRYHLDLVKENGQWRIADFN